MKRANLPTPTWPLLIALVAFVVAALAPGSSGAIFAKYDGIDGESQDANHLKWIDILSLDWGAHRPAGAARNAVVVNDMTLTMEYDKAAPKLQEALFVAKVISTLNIEQTATFGGARATYLKYELEDVVVTSFRINSSGNDEAGPPTMVVKCRFEAITVTYTEFDEAGNSLGNVVYTWIAPEDS